MKKKVEFVPRAPHHAYIGLMLMFLGWTMIPYALYNGLDTIFLLGGWLIFMDDVVEHTITGSTPLHIFFNKIMVPILVRLGR